MIEAHQSVARRVMLKAFLTGTTTAAAGKTIAIVISKNGAAFGNPSAGATNATELANGWYFVDLSTADCDTLGDLVVRGTEGTIDPAERLFSVVAATNRGMTNLNATVSSRASQTSVDDIPTTAEFEARTIVAANYFDPAADKVTLADGVAHGGSTATLQLGASGATAPFLIQNSGGPAVRWEATAANNNGVMILGHGSGAGVYVSLNGIGASGNAVTFAAPGMGAGLSVTSASGSEIDADLAGSVASVSGAVVASIATGGIAAASFAAGAIDAAAIAAGAIDAATFAADVDAEIRSYLGLASANLDTQLADIPTVAEFEARTLVAANYFDPAADTVANVTTVGSVTTKTGYALTAGEHTSIADATLGRAVSNVEATADKHSLALVVALATNASETGGTLTAKKPSDDTAWFTYTVVADAAADPITSIS